MAEEPWGLYAAVALATADLARLQYRKWHAASGVSSGNAHVLAPLCMDVSPHSSDAIALGPASYVQTGSNDRGFTRPSSSHSTASESASETDLASDTEVQPDADIPHYPSAYTFPHHPQILPGSSFSNTSAFTRPPSSDGLEETQQRQGQRVVGHPFSISDTESEDSFQSATSDASQ
jgi:hypothetical protein